MMATRSAVLFGSLLLAGLALSLAEPVVLTTENFDRMVSDGSAYFIKFYAPWCGHCKRLAPTWDELSDAMADTKLKIAKVDCTVHKDVCSKADVRGYPTLKIYYKGEEYKKHSGGRSFDALKSYSEDIIDELF